MARHEPCDVLKKLQTECVKVRVFRIVFIDSLLQLPGRHVCVFGDMLELGPEEREMHREIGAYAAEKGVDLLLCAGPLSRELAAGAGDCASWFSDREELLRALPELIRDGDRVLVKASRGMHFERVAEALKQL